MIPVFYSDVFSSLTFDSFAMQLEELPEPQGGKIKFYITSEFLKQNGLLTVDAYFEDMLNLFNIKERPNNYGVAIFDAFTYEVQYIQYPIIGLDSSGNPVLRIGSTTKDGQVGVDIPLIADDNEDSDNTYHFLTNEKIKVDLLPVTSDNGAEQTTYYYVSAKTPKKPSYTHIFSILLDKNIDGSSLPQYWYESNIELAMRSFFSVGINLSKAFSTSFQTGEFPKNGVLLLLVDGYVKESKNDNGRTFTSTSWKLAGSSHPNLLTVSYSTDELVPLSNVGYVSCSSSCSASKALMTAYSSLGKPEDYRFPYYLLWLTSVNYRDGVPRYDFIPKNTGSKSLRTLPPAIKQYFPTFLKEVESLVANLTSVAFNSGGEARDITEDTNDDAKYFKGDIPAF